PATYVIDITSVSCFSVPPEFLRYVRRLRTLHRNGRLPETQNRGTLRAKGRSVSLAPDALAYAFPPNGGWNSGDLTADSAATSWHISVNDLLDVMGCFRLQGTIMSPTAAQAMLDNGFGNGCGCQEMWYLPLPPS